jgi:ankyrin repeat protein
MNTKATIAVAMAGSIICAGAALAAGAGDVSLVTAAKQGDRAAVQLLLNEHGKHTVAGPDGTAALVWAATRNDLAMADLLLRAGANAKAANELGATPLYAAAAHPDPAMTEKLLAAGADPNAPLMSGETPLMEAARRGNLATVRVLLSNHANPNVRESNGGQNALMWAVSQRQSAVVEELLKNGADVQSGSKTGFTALMFAAQQGDDDSARILLRAGAKPNDAQPKTGLTALMIASAMAHTKAVEVLLDGGADPNLADANGYTSLHRVVRDSDYGINLAAKDDILTVVQSLLKHGANPNARLVQDKEKAAEEIKNGNVQIEGKRSAVTVDEIILQGATPLFLAAEVNNLDVIKTLVAAGADPLIVSDRGTTPLMMAAGAGTDVQREREPEERVHGGRDRKVPGGARRRRQRRGTVRMDGAACGRVSGIERRHRILGQQGRKDRSEGRVRTDGVEHFSVGSHQGDRGTPPADPAQIPAGHSRTAAQAWRQHARQDRGRRNPPAERRLEPGESRSLAAGGW